MRKTIADKTRTSAGVKQTGNAKTTRSSVVVNKDKKTAASIPSAPKTQTRLRGNQPAKKPVRLTRLEARVPEQLNNKILEAASIKGTTKTDFLVFALDEVASRVILEEATLQLHIDDQKALAEVLIADKPHPPVRKMSRLRKYGEEYAKRVEQK